MICLLNISNFNISTIDKLFEVSIVSNNYLIFNNLLNIKNMHFYCNITN